MSTGTPHSTRPVIDSPTDRVPSPFKRPEPGRHRLDDSTPAQFRAPYVVKVHQPDAAPAHRPRRVRTYKPGVTSTQQLTAYVRGGVA